eukprot:14361172-Alexandrium_andersonii.AAC.1
MGEAISGEIRREVGGLRATVLADRQAALPTSFRLSQLAGDGSGIVEVPPAQWRDAVRREGCGKFAFSAH